MKILISWLVVVLSLHIHSLQSAQYNNNEKKFSSRWEYSAPVVLSTGLVGLITAGYAVQKLYNGSTLSSLAENPLFISGAVCTGLLGLASLLFQKLH